jgi:lipopolysaccharide biosynthesis glycosyltransferase
MIIFIAQNCKKIKVIVKFIACELPANANATGHITTSAYLRIDIPKIFQGKVIWFDADLLFLDGWQKILDYFKQKFSEIKTIQARLHWHDPQSATNQAIIHSNGKYFNSGVLLFNSKRWRKEKIYESLAPIMDRYDYYGFEWADQCVLNYFFKGVYEAINPKFNAIPSEYQLNQTRILHFAGSHKPWTFRIDHNAEIISIQEDQLFTEIPENEILAFSLYRKYEVELFKKLRHEGNFL